jgi:NAD(P)-binding Rossmann-like domain
VTKSLCIVGGGPASVGLAWTLAQDPTVAAEWAITIIHDEDVVGGHCATYDVTNPLTKATIAVDIGVQYVAPLINPNVSLMLGEAAFKQAAPVVDAAPLTVACGFPPRNGQSMNWGNFPAYQNGTLFALYNQSGMVADCEDFQTFMASLFPQHLDKATESVQDWLNSPTPNPLTNVTDFVDYFIDPYMTIINGYGAPDLDSVMLADILPLFGKMPFFPGPMGSMTTPGVGWQRWTLGARSWVQTMLDVAQTTMSVSLVGNTTVHGVWLQPGNPSGPVSVSCNANLSDPVTFDKVVLTTDMTTNARLLNNTNNTAAWNTYYADALSSSRWSVLQDGTCYIHADETVLAPDLIPLQQEVAQFTAYYSTAGAKNGMPYNTDTTYATYLMENVHQDPNAQQLYVTMYGPSGTIVKPPVDPIVTKQFIHGLWLPDSMKNSTKNVYVAQGAGGINGGNGPLPNTGTNLYFAGNNTTMDSVEGALVSAMVIANYAFGVAYPMPLEPLTATALAMYLYQYLGLMFPVSDAATRHALTQQLTLATVGAGRIGPT